ncbi:hypothetical protein BYT27DRAFT_7214063 [Phlegmacium glaucopus]|nr:hypothetical protein BYT27DRAFT_7214063 [Phlegmacium glaucopus]
MPTGKREQAIFVTSGRPTLSTEVLTEQAKFVVEMGPYLKQAEGNNQESEFYDAMFKLWFSRWPEIPLDKDDIDFAAHRVEVTKKACKHDLSWTRVTKTIVLKPWQEFIAEKQDIFDAAQKEPSKRTFDNAFKSEKGMLQRQQRSPCRALSAMEKEWECVEQGFKVNRRVHGFTVCRIIMVGSGNKLFISFGRGLLSSSNLGSISNYDGTDDSTVFAPGPKQSGPSN